MGKTIIYPTILKGEIKIPPSKSICHRAIICGGLSGGVSSINNVDYSDDILATCNAMEALGVKINKNESSLEISGKNLGQLRIDSTDIDCQESGSTLRFLIPIAAALGRKTTFKGHGKLIERPLNAYYDIFDKQHFSYTNCNGKLPLTIWDKLKADVFKIPGNISSQYISGLLLGASLLEGDSRIVLTTELESKPYVDLTIDILNKHSIIIENNAYKEFFIRGNQSYKPINYCVEGDYSQAAFWLTANLFGCEINCMGLNIDSIQGDKSILKFIEMFGGKVEYQGGRISVNPLKTNVAVINASEYPDLVPILAVLGALSEGTTEITNAERLRYKESDRLRAISTELTKIGAVIKETMGGLIITGKSNLKGGVVNSWNDHRIAMALAIASIKCKEPLIIENSECVKKSYPHFWEHFKLVGGIIDEWNLGE